ncbi:hypothetical protein GLYMA_07G128900v4 [Glycine max]|uniref:Uncharacterized protein n=2 Tax=Glycine subgen. Soja TaxID=1462606 RepID=A0A0R0J937_SOYBN|nr:hypothetical protein GLYMA_07G128900v4 [Glycine max]RZC02710.1 hypothetical protein D0Y65_017710 [Glycine soja]
MAEEPKVPPPSDPPLPFDPSRMIGIIKRKALIKDLAAVYHAECLAYCQELLELQTKWEEVFRWLMHNSFRAQKMHHLRIYLFLAAGVYLLVSEHIFNVVSMYFSNATET